VLGWRRLVLGRVLDGVDVEVFAVLVLTCGPPRIDLFARAVSNSNWYNHTKATSRSQCCSRYQHLSMTFTSFSSHITYLHSRSD
jgi:hypothetical protein